jgi:hypothetical protein
MTSLVDTFSKGSPRYHKSAFLTIALFHISSHVFFGQLFKLCNDGSPKWNDSGIRPKTRLTACGDTNRHCKTCKSFALPPNCVVQVLGTSILCLAIAI